MEELPGDGVQNEEEKTNKQRIKERKKRNKAPSVNVLNFDVSMSGACHALILFGKSPKERHLVQCVPQAVCKAQNLPIILYIYRIYSMIYNIYQSVQMHPPMQNIYQSPISATKASIAELCVEAST